MARGIIYSSLKGQDECPRTEEMIVISSGSSLTSLVSRLAVNSVAQRQGGLYPLMQIADFPPLLITFIIYIFPFYLGCVS